MKKNIFKFLGFAFAFAALVFAVGGAFGFFDLTFLAGGENGISLGFAAAAGTTSTDTVTTDVKKSTSSDLLRPDIDKVITKIQPDKFPFDTVLRNIGAEKKVNSYETKYYSSETRGLTDTVNGAVSAVVGAAEHATLAVVVDNQHMWNVHDVLLVQGDTHGSDGLPITFLIVAKSGSTLTCLPLNGTGTNGFDTPLIADAAVLGRIGHAKSELDAMTSPYAVMPQPTSNYCQTNMAMVEESLIAKIHEQEVDWNLVDMYNQALWDFRTQNEMIGLMGFKKYAYDPTAGNYKYTAGGIVRQITKSLSWNATTMNNATFQGWAKSIFTGNNGSERRILFAGSGFMEGLGAVPTIQKQIESKETEVVYGVKFHRIESNFGELLVKHHSGLHVVGMEDSGIVLDPAFIEKHTFVPMKTDKKDLITPGIRKADASVIDETWCAVAKNLDTHAIISKA